MSLLLRYKGALQGIPSRDYARLLNLKTDTTLLNSNITQHTVVENRQKQSHLAISGFPRYFVMKITCQSKKQSGKSVKKLG